MREIALAVKASNKHITDYLFTFLKANIDFCQTIITTYCDNNFCYLLFACDQEYVQPCETIVKEAIIDYIESVYKVEYLQSRIKNPTQDKMAFDAYIKVLAVFDKTTDSNALEKIIMFNQTFFVDSFLEFRLTPLKHHWDNLVSLSCDNLSMFNSSTFTDVIRFLLNTMDNSVYKLKVVCEEHRFCIYNMKNKNAKIKKVAECDNFSDLISNVLTSCPNYVDVYLNTKQNNEAVSFLSNVFSNRLKIFMKN